MYLQLQLMVEVVQHRVYIAPRQVPVSQQKNVRYQELHVVSHKQVHQCAVSKVVCVMSSGRYLNLSGRGSSFDRSRLARRMANLDTARSLHLFDLALQVGKISGPKGPRGTRGNGDISEACFILYIFFSFRS